MASPFGNAQWLGDTQLGYSVYRYHFDIAPEVSVGSFNLRLNTYSDDGLVSVYVNSTKIYSNPGASYGFVSWTGVPLVLNQGFNYDAANPAANDIYMVVRNTTGVSGLLVQATGSASCQPKLNVTKKAVNNDANGTAFTGAVAAGQPVYYDITVTNSGTTDASGTVLNDLLPSGFSSGQVISCTTAPAPNVAAICPSLPYPANTASTIINNLALPKLEGGGFLTFRVQAVFGGVTPLPAAITNTATIAPPAGKGFSCDAVNGVSPCSDSATVGSEPLLAVTKSIAEAGPLYPGELANYTVKVINSGNVALTNVVVTDQLPAGFESATWACQQPVGSLATCPAGANASGTLTANGTPGDTLHSTIASLPAGQSLNYVITATVNDSTVLVAPLNDVTNTVTVTADGSWACVDPVTNAAKALPCNASAVVNLSPVPQLSVSKNVPASPTVYTPGQTVPYTVTVSNPGTVPITDVTISDTVPSAFTSVVWACTTSNAVCSSAAFPNTTNTLNLSGVILAAGESLVITANAVVSSTLDASQNDLPNTAIVASSSTTTPWTCVPATTGPCESTALTNLVVDPQLSIVKTLTSTATTYHAGDTVSYSIKVSNLGNVALPNVEVADTLLTGLEAGTWSCVPDATTPCPSGMPSGAAQALDVTLPSLAKGETLTFNVTTTVSAAPPPAIPNTATATSSQTLTKCVGGTSTTLPCAYSVNINITTVTKPAAGDAVPVPVDKPWMLVLMTLVLMEGAAQRRRVQRVARNDQR